MNTWRKVGCCLVAAAAAFGAMSVSAKGIVDIIGSYESSPYNTQYKLSPEKAFKPSDSYFLSGSKFSAGTVFYLQANLTESYTPTSYTLDMTVASGSGRKRNPCGFRLLGCTGTDGNGADIWTLLDEQPHVYWSNTAAEWIRTFGIIFPRACTKLKLEVFDVCANDNLCIHQLTFDDTPLVAQTACDLVSMARGLDGEGAAVAESGAVLGGCAANVVDGSFALDLTRLTDADNGLWYAELTEGTRSVTVTFDAAALGGVIPLLTGYQLYKWNGTDSAVGAACQPRAWAVYASEKESPGADGWHLVDARDESTVGTSDTIGGVKYSIVDVDAQNVMPARKIKFEVLRTGEDGEGKALLGEVRFRGVVPNEPGNLDCVVGGSAVESVSHQAATVQVIVFPKSGETAPYDLFFDCVHEDRTNVIRVASSCTALGSRTYALDKLKVGTDYVLQARIVNASGSVSRGPELEVQTEAEDAVEFPDGFNKLEWVQSTEDGHQGIVLGAQPQNFGLEVDCIFYNALAKGNNWDSTTNTYGVLYTGGDTFTVSTSTGQGGDYSSGLRLDSRPRAANLSAEIIGKRIQIAHRDTYTVTPEDGVPLSDSRDPSSATSRICLMGGINASAPTGMDQWSVMRLYSVTVYKRHDDDTVTHFYQPAQAEDGTNGLLDMLDENPETAWYPCVGETNLVAGAILPAGSFETAVDSFTGTRLKATLTRGNAVLEDAIFAVWGPDYGGIGAEGWAHQQALGKSFKAGEQTAAVTLKGLADSDVYVRFYTANGRWSQTIYLPDLERKRSGLVLLLK